MSKSSKVENSKKVSRTTTKSSSKTAKKAIPSKKIAKKAIPEKKKIAKKASPKYKKKHDYIISEEDSDDVEYDVKTNKNKKYEYNSKNDTSSSDSSSEEENDNAVVDDESAKIFKRMNILISEISNHTVAQSILFFNDEDIITTSVGEKKLIFIFDKKDKIYKIISHDVLRQKLFVNIREYTKFYRGNTLKEMYETKDGNVKGKLLEKVKMIDDLLRKIGTTCFMNGTIDLIVADPKFRNDDILKIFDVKNDVVNFKNGLVDLKTGLFRTRTPDDYYTKTLDYDYVEKVNKKISENLKTIFSRICNDDEETTENIKIWLGYCMTGEIDQHRSMWFLGHSASNGKSTLLEAFDAMYHIYCCKLSNQAYELGYQKKHKQFIRLKNIRCAWIEELNKNKLNITDLKEHIGGKSIGGNEVLYGSAEDIIINFKLNFVSNYYPKFISDNGMIRRGYALEHTNRFVEQKTYDTSKNKKGLYIRDTTIKQLICKDEYKNALFNMLLPYATKYYTNGFKDTNMNILDDNWKRICFDNDKMSLFIGEKFEKTDDENDRIGKEDFLEMYRQHYELKKISFVNLLEDIKRINIIYKPQASIKGKKGVIVGLKKLDEEDNDNSINDLF